MLSVEFKLSNVKSHYQKDPITFSIEKPISIIAGPNGEGKSNLLEGFLWGISKFIDRSNAHRSKSSFTKEIDINKLKGHPLSFKKIVFTDLLQKSFYRKSLLPERLLASSMLSFGMKKGYCNFKINRDAKIGEGKVNLAESTTVFKKSNIETNGNYKNEIGQLDLFYINSDSYLNDFFVKFVGHEFSEALGKKSGNIPKMEYHKKILGFFPEDGQLINDVDTGRFQEKYSTGQFLTSSLPTGAKKECLLYMMGILKERYKGRKDWMAVFLVDEIESGLNINREKKMADALIEVYLQEPELQNHIKIIATTHSPVIYSELSKHNELVDVHYVLRVPNKPTIVVNSKEDVQDKKIIEKRLLTELGLNIFDLPHKILFVEGKTDKLFFDEIFNDVGILPFRGGSVPEIVRDLILAHSIARTRDYCVLVDKNILVKVKKDMDGVMEDDDSGDINIKLEALGFNSLEEFIFDVNVGGQAHAETLCNRIEEKIEHFDLKLKN
jgi:predicted ATPase